MSKIPNISGAAPTPVPAALTRPAGCCFLTATTLVFFDEHGARLPEDPVNQGFIGLRCKAIATPN